MDFLIAGDSVDFVTSVPSYLASSGYTLKYRLVPRAAGPTPILLTAAAVGDDYRTTATPATTAAWTPGEYTEGAWVEKSGERHTVDGAFLPFSGSGGLCTIRPDPAVITAFDGRSIARKALDDLRTAMATFQSSGGQLKRYAIAGREMEFQSSADIVYWIKYWTNEVTREDQRKAVANGMPDPRLIKLRIG